MFFIHIQKHNPRSVAVQALKEYTHTYRILQDIVAHLKLKACKFSWPELMWSYLPRHSHNR